MATQTENTKQVTPMKWQDFRDTGLVVVINQILHIFGWAIVFEVEVGSDVIKSVYPARVKFRGFSVDSTERAYKKISQYMVDNATVLNDEAQE